MFKKTKFLCDRFLEMGIPGTDLCIYKDGECVLRYTKGFSDLENQTPLNGKERYNIYSCSKPITCVAAMQLFEKGLFSLEDKLSDYMPEFTRMTVKTSDGIKKAEKPILIEHLFQMSAGFSYDCYSQSLKKAIEDTHGKCPTREVMKYLALEPLLFEPGTRWEYSLCHDVLAAFVEVVSGQKFNDYVTDNIFRPLGMNDTSFIISKEERENLASQYRFDAEKKEFINCGKGNWYVIGSEYASGGAGCVSTVDDYIKFLEALRTGNKILKSETIKLMTTDRLTDELRKTYWINERHGYGLGLRCPKEGGIYKDSGWGGAAGAYLAFDIDNGISLFYAQHVLSSPNQGLREDFYLTTMAELIGKKEFEELFEKKERNGEYRYTF